MPAEPVIAKRCGACQDCCHPEPVWCDSWGRPPTAVAIRIEYRNIVWEERRAQREALTDPDVWGRW